MFLTLYLKECKQVLKGLTYYFIIICMALFYFSQLGNTEVVTKPQPGLPSYGWTVSDDKAVIMEKTLEVFAREYAFNKYYTYPYGFCKKVTLGNRKKAKMGEILLEVTGLEKEKLDSYLREHYYKGFDSSTSSDTSITISKDAAKDGTGLTIEQDSGNNSTSISVEEASEQEQEAPADYATNTTAEALTVKQGMTYENFTEFMSKADKLLGGGSNYHKDSLQNNAYVQRTYEQALADYKDIIEKDRLTGAYARLFCDYIGIVLAILPIFIAVTRFQRDRRAKANEIIFTRKASSLQIVLSRYFAMLTMLLLPVFLISLSMLIECIVTGSRTGVTIDYLAFPKYILGWLLPTMMVTTSVGVFFTELTDTAIAIIFQGLWWFISLMGNKNLTGGYGWNLVPRHNSLGEYQTYSDNFNTLVTNRITYTIISIVLIIAAVGIYDLKRKGRLNIRGKIFTNRKK